MTADADRPLEGLLILDLVEGPLAPVSRLYADLGAEVVRVCLPGREETPQGRDGLARRIGDLGKRILALDPATAEGAQALGALLQRACMVVCGGEFRADVDARIQAVASERPDLVVMDVSMFGRDGPYASWQATDLVLHALSGMLSRSGVRGREPLAPPGDLAIRCALEQAALAGLVTLYRALLTGQGGRIDFAALDGAVQALDPGFGMGGTAAMGQPASAAPRDRPEAGTRYPILTCADGHVRICLLAPRQWQGMFRWMGEPQAFADPKFNDTYARFRSPELAVAIAEFFAGKTRAELEHEAHTHGVPLSALRSVEECLGADHLLARGAFVDRTLLNGRTAPVPNGVIEIDDVRMGPRARPAAPAADRPASRTAAAGPLPLSGLKVLDLGVIVVGAEQGRLLGDLGADVVKVESRQFLDGARQVSLPVGVSSSFATGHRNKRSLGLNLRSPEGKAVFRRLAAEADVVLSNFKPGVLESLELGRDVLSALNPRLITLESSAFGADGTWGERMGYGPLVRAAAGVTEAWRYEDDPESFADSITIYPDHVAARVGAAAVMALLIRRVRTGRGGAARIAQLEVMLDHFSAAIAGRALGEAGLDGPPDAPWGVYPCAGDDEWCAVTVRDDRDWRALAEVIGCDATRFATRAERLSARAALESALAAWLLSRSPQAAMEALQAAGAPAGRMLRVSDLPAFGYFQARRFFRAEHHPLLADEVVAERFVVQAEDLDDPPSRPAPALGEHTAEVMREWLGLGEAEITRLVGEGVLEPAAL